MWAHLSLALVVLRSGSAFNNSKYGKEVGVCRAEGSCASKVVTGDAVLATHTSARMVNERTVDEDGEDMAIDTTTGATLSYRLSNRGVTGWRPAVKVKAYNDRCCSKQISVSALSVHNCSGFSSNGTQAESGCARALDASSIAWQPQCHPCQVGDVWIEFTSSVEVRCLVLPGNNLGQGEGRGESWSGGLTIAASDKHKFHNEHPNTLKVLCLERVEVLGDDAYAGDFPLANTSQLQDECAKYGWGSGCQDFPGLNVDDKCELAVGELWKTNPEHANISSFRIHSGRLLNCAIVNTCVLPTQVYVPPAQTYTTTATVSAGLYVPPAKTDTATATVTPGVHVHSAPRTNTGVHAHSAPQTNTTSSDLTTASSTAVTPHCSIDCSWLAGKDCDPKRTHATSKENHNCGKATCFYRAGVCDCNNNGKFDPGTKEREFTCISNNKHYKGNVNGEPQFKKPPVVCNDICEHYNCTYTFYTNENCVSEELITQEAMKKNEMKTATIYPPGCYNAACQKDAERNGLLKYHNSSMTGYRPTTDLIVRGWASYVELDHNYKSVRFNGWGNCKVLLHEKPFFRGVNGSFKGHYTGADQANKPWNAVNQDFSSRCRNINLEYFHGKTGSLETADTCWGNAF